MPRSFERGLCPRNPRGEASEGGRSPPPRTWCAAGCRDRPHDTLCRARSSSALARATLRGGYRRGGGAPLRGHGAPPGPCSPGMSGPRRSFHFVPGGNEKMIAKALTLPADALILHWLEERHGVAFGSTALLLIATETPEGLLNIAEVARASARIAAVSWGIEDLSAAMGLPRTRDAEGRYLDIPRYARVMTALAAAAAGVQAIDTVYTDIPNLEGLRRECQEGFWMGFTGKISIHPGQIPVINDVFTPSKEDVQEARELIAAFDEHRQQGSGAFAFKGQMVDMPHLTRARKIVERARRTEQ